MIITTKVAVRIIAVLFVAILLQNAFFSMVERRKKLHREVIETFAESEHHLLATAIPYAADVERMGVHRQPVRCFAPSCAAAAAYRALWSDLHRLFNHHRI